MIDFTNINPILTFLIILASIFGGGIAAFFIIRKQLFEISNAALQVTKDELEVYKGKVDRMEKEIGLMIEKLKLVSAENLSLVSERDYLKSLIISAITSRKEIHKELLDELKNADAKTKVIQSIK